MLPFKDTKTPSARFQKSQRATRLHFNSACLKFGLGSRFKSADLYWEPDTKEIILELHEDPYAGQRRLFIEHPKSYPWVTLACTRFLKEFDIEFRLHCRYPVACDAERVFVDLSSYENIKRKVHS